MEPRSESALIRGLGVLVSLARDESGATLVTAGAGMMMVMGFAALAVDGAQFYVQHNKLQTSADAAVLAAVSQLPDTAKAATAAQGIVTANLPPASHGQALASGDIVLGSWNSQSGTFTAGTASPNAVQVTVRRTTANGNPVRTYFGQVFGIETIDMAATAIAGMGRGPICMLALEPSQPAVLVNSNSAITANGCVVQVNSTHDEAIRTNANSDVTADAIYVKGDYAGNGYTPTPDTGMPVITDPLIGLQPPSTAEDACDYTGLTVSVGDDVTLDPGVYCNGLVVNSNASATFEPGIYIIRDGQLTVNSNSSISGTGVSFYFTGSSATINLNSNSQAILSAPVSGPMAGIALFQDRNMADGSVNVLNSNTSSIIEGTAYFPNGAVQLNSNTTLGQTSPNSSMIARTFTINSNSELILNSNTGASSVPVPKGLAKKNNAVVR